jgi:hypothetical protein
MKTRTRNLVWSALSCSVFAASGCGKTDDADPNGGRGGGVHVSSAKPGGSGCLLNGDCASARCDAGICTEASSGKSAAPPTPGPHFIGTGVSYRPLTPGCGPDTSGECGGGCEQNPGKVGAIVRAPATLCFEGDLDATPEDPTAVIEQVIEDVNGQGVVHLRVTFDPSFVDNTYGAGACCGWPEADTAAAPMMPAPGGKADPMMAGKAGKAGHTFNDLVGSDHLELLLTNGSGDTVMDFKIDYISEDSSAPCGYRSLGVQGGEGKMIVGDAGAILGVSTSLDRNLNGCGYCYTVDSPETDEDYSANPDAPNWDYRVVYEVWIDLDAFGDEGFGQAYINNVHASPSKLQNNTVEVDRDPCPPDWEVPYCHPDVSVEGRNCYDQDSDCPPNYTIYVQTEGKSWCTPIPFSNYPGRAPCPEGYYLDPVTEGRYCLPNK